jgi:D-cysteine desulfhydrase
MVSPPRFPLAVLPTPLVYAERLSGLAGTPILVKRDDLTGFGASGNKARALEYLLGAALAGGCDVLVTGGSASSNFCPAAALAAARAGMGCELVISGAGDSANLEIARRAGARLHRLGGADRDRIDGAVGVLAAELAADGRRPYPIPRGGSTATGALGFAFAAGELSAQLSTQLSARSGAEPELVVIAVGSGGSCAGLLAGPGRTRLLGVSVSRPPDEVSAIVHGLAGECATLLGRPQHDLGRLEIVDGRGPGFGVPGPDDLAAAAVALETEGLLLDHTYTAKALAVLLDTRADGPVVFWHTGGLVTAITEYVAADGRRHEPVTT